MADVTIKTGELAVGDTLYHFFDTIRKLESNKKSYIYTFLNGPFEGDRAALTYDDREYTRTHVERFIRGKERFIGANESCKEDDSKNENLWEKIQSYLYDNHSNGVHTIPGTDIRFFAEKACKESRMVICGAGHVSMPIIAIAGMTGFHVTVIEDRQEFADMARTQGADEVICRDFCDALESIESDEDTFFVVVTREHSYDRECLRVIAHKPYAYIGMMGSRKRAAALMNVLVDEDSVPADVAWDIHMPIGLEIKADTPEEIAVSVMAEVIEIRNSRNHGTGYSKDILRTILDEKTYPLVLTTIIDKTGSAPRSIGTKMLVRNDGSIVGTIGGGLVEAEVVEKSLQLMKEKSQKLQIMHIDMDGSVEDHGMACGGSVDILLEMIADEG